MFNRLWPFNQRAPPSATNPPANFVAVAGEGDEIVSQWQLVDIDDDGALSF